MERYGKRDIHYHVHRRTYGNLPAIDIDMIECDHNDQPILMQELKHGKVASPLYLSSMQKSINIANLLNIPLILTVYWFLTKRGKFFVPINAGEDLPIEHIQYWCYPLNDRAKQLLPHDGKDLTELEYIYFLHSVKGTTPPSGSFYFIFLDQFIPPEIRP